MINLYIIFIIYFESITSEFLLLEVYLMIF